MNSPEKEELQHEKLELKAQNMCNNNTEVNTIFTR